ncbi:MAG TPA: DUF6582 domain-containing protein [Thermomicrobiales bacterium]
MAKARKRPQPRPGKKSTAKGVKRLPASQFAYPKTREYPINTAKRFRAALSYAGRKTTSGSRATIVRRGLRSSNSSVRAAAKRAAKRK